MKFIQVAKRVSLFILVNILVVGTIGLILSLLGINTRYPKAGQHYQGLMAFCLVWGMASAFISLALSRIMAKWLMGVKVIDPNTTDREHRELVQTVHRLARAAGLTTMPEVGFYESEEINAFATGPTRSRSLVAVSSGLLNAMGRDEVAGVLAHEISHVANGDMVTMTLVQGVINAFVMFLARVLAFAVTQAMRSRDDERSGGGSPIIQFVLIWVFEIVLTILGSIVVCTFSRWREFRADAGGAKLAGRENMISALQALKNYSELKSTEETSTGGAAAFQSLKISGDTSRFMHLFATHPALEVRIARLQKGE